MIFYLKLQQSYRAKPVYESSGDAYVQESYRIEIKKTVWAAIWVYKEDKEQKGS